MANRSYEDDPVLMKAVLDALKEGSKIRAIREFRDRTGVSLKEAQQQVERIAETRAARISRAKVSGRVAGEGASLEKKEEVVEGASLHDLWGLGREDMALIMKWIGEGHRLEAVNRVRDITGQDFETADSLLTELEAVEAGTGISGPAAKAEVKMANRFELDRDTTALILTRIRQGHKIEAIKLVRELTGLGLKEAKEIVDELEGVPANEVRRPASTPPPLPQRAANTDLVRAVLVAQHESGKINAIKVYRELTGQGLKESKDEVEKILTAHGMNFDPKPPPLPTPAVAPPPPRSSGAQAPKPAPVPPPPAQSSKDQTDVKLAAEIQFLFRTGKKKEALKRYMEGTGADKRTAQKRVEEIGRNLSGGRTDKRCFIATACLGEDSPEVERLRRFRDERLLPSGWGPALVSAYYFLSPPLARFIETHGWLRNLVRRILIEPLVRRIGRKDF